MSFIKSNIKKIFLALFFLIIFIFLISLSLQRYFIVQLYFYVFGIFTQVLWRLSRFSYPYINHLVLGKVHFLGDHFQPSLIILTPLFWISSNISILVLQQAFASFGSVVLIYLISKKHKISFIGSLIISSAFLIFSGTLNPLLTDWHPEPTAGFFLLLFYYFYLFTNKNILSGLLFFIFLGFKESNSITAFFLLVYMFFAIKNKRRITFIFLLVCIFWFFMTTRFIIPGISRSFYLYYPEISLNPQVVLKSIIEKPQKIQLVFRSLISFGFIPILSGLAIIPIIGELGIRIFPTKSLFENFTFGFHYSVYLGIVLTISTIIAIAYWKKRLGKKYNVELFLCILLLFSALLTGRKLTYSPMNMAISPIFWKELKPNKEFFNFINKIPKNGSVMSQNNVLAYVSNRKEDLYYLKKRYWIQKPDTIAFDLTPGQNPNNFYESAPESILMVRDSLINDQYYKLLYEHNGRYIFVRINK